MASLLLRLPGTCFSSVLIMVGEGGEGQRWLQQAKAGQKAPLNPSPPAGGERRHQGGGMDPSPPVRKSPLAGVSLPHREMNPVSW